MLIITTSLFNFDQAMIYHFWLYNSGYYGDTCVFLFRDDRGLKASKLRNAGVICLSVTMRYITYFLNGANTIWTLYDNSPISRHRRIAQSRLKLVYARPYNQWVTITSAWLYIFSHFRSWIQSTFAITANGCCSCCISFLHQAHSSLALQTSSNYTIFSGTASAYCRPYASVSLQ